MAIAMRYGSNDYTRSGGASGGGGSGGGGITMSLIWTNPNPTATFAAQTVAVDLSGYDAVLIAFLGSGDVSRQMTQLCFFGGNVLVGSIEASSGVRTRKATVSSSDIVFGGGYNDGSSANGVCIPLYIYGIKGIT